MSPRPGQQQEADPLTLRHSAGGLQTDGGNVPEQIFPGIIRGKNCHWGLSENYTWNDQGECLGPHAGLQVSAYSEVKVKNVNLYSAL